MIRDVQLAALLAAPREAYYRRLERTAQRCYPQRVAELGEEATRALVRDLVESAESYGFNTERDVAHVVDLYLRLGPAFEEREDMAWVLELLGDTTRAPAARIDAIHAGLDRLAGENSP